MDSPYWKGPLPGVDVQRRLPVENIPGASRTAFRGRPKSVRLRPGIRVRLQPGMVFGISPESCSASPRNAVRLAPEYARHVLAAAVKCGAQTIVTFNLKHFRDEHLGVWGIEAQSPDSFLTHQYHLDPSATIMKLCTQASRIGWDIH